MRRELGEARGVHLFDGGNALENRLGVENVKIGVGGGAGDRVGRVRVSVKKARERSAPVKASWTRSVVSVAASGRNPPVRPLATHIKSGNTPARSQANIRPVRPNPVRTSSAMSKTSWVVVRRRMPARNSSG